MNSTNANNNGNSTVYCQTENPDDKSSIITIICRICYDSEKDEPIVAPCKCKGTVAYVHRSCLETWLAESNTTSCELCHFVYKTRRTPKYPIAKSVWRWITKETPNFGFTVRGIRNDIITCSFLTPLAVVITYICLFSADYYNQQRFSHIPAAKWTSVSLLIMVVIMLIGYYLWAYMAIQYHSRVWYYWWQRECIVRIPSEELRFSNAQEDNHANRNDDDDNNGSPDRESSSLAEIQENNTNNNTQSLAFSETVANTSNMVIENDNNYNTSSHQYLENSTTNSPLGIENSKLEPFTNCLSQICIQDIYIINEKNKNIH